LRQIFPESRIFTDDRTFLYSPDPARSHATMHLVVLSTYPPRRCGLATFTADLRSALRTSAPRWRVDVCAVDRDGLAYGPEVVEVLDQDDRDGYRRAARAVAATGADLVVIQHEYGIFGGPDGSHVLEFADELAAHGLPYAVTLHTVLAAPSPGQARVLARLCRGAARVTGFTETSRRIATRAGTVAPARFAVVPHGVPARLAGPAAVAAVGPALGEALAAVEGARVLSTFGLLRPGKGLETVVAAMPAVVARHPDVRYVVAGATHPEVVRASGEQYRTGLAALARDLGVAGQVRFADTFLTEAELVALLRRTDVYLTPYRSVEQTCSGPLTFALAAGCAVVSTSYRYAMEMVMPAGEPARGALVPFDNPAAFAAAINELLDDPERLAETRRAAQKLAAELTWPAVGTSFAAVFAAAVPGAGVGSTVRMRPARLAELVAKPRVTPVPGGEPLWSPSRPPPASASPGR
jgi:glycosyltransferase involved in cell wall biosynthesis